MKLEAGMFARSKAGHDNRSIYVIISVQDEYVYLADGDLKTVCHPKKKNRRHIQPICCDRCESVSDDTVIRKAVKARKKLMNLEK